MGFYADFTRRDKHTHTYGNISDKSQTNCTHKKLCDYNEYQ